MMPMLPDTKDLADRAVWAKVEEDLETFGFGGYIVFRGDKDKTPPYLEELQEISEVPLLFGSDLERGAGQQLAGDTTFPFPMALGATRDQDLAYQQGAITALEAKRAGIHWIFAPTLDLTGFAENPIINIRGLGDEPRQVGNMGAAFIAGAQRYHAIATAKHFPGHGQTTVDSHHDLPVVSVSRSRLELNDLAPFRHAIEMGVRSIMVGHLSVPALDETGLPATMSKRIVSDLLRDQLGFTGLVVTDAMMMGAITERYDPGQAAVRALQAGVDVLLMPPDPQAVVDAVLRAIEEGALTKHRLLESVERIFQAKAEQGLWAYDYDEDDDLPSQLPDYEPAVSAIAESANTLVDARDGILPLKADQRVFSLVLDDDNDEEAQAGWREALAAHPDVPVRVLTPESTEDEINDAIEQARQYDVVVTPIFMAVRAWKNRVTLDPVLARIPGELREAGAKVVAVSFTSPYVVRQFPDVEAYVCAYAPHRLSQRAAVQALWGELPFPGRLPVDLALLSPNA
jgi:beta-glucosidase-like glycosyl hydrolase